MTGLGHHGMQRQVRQELDRAVLEIRRHRSPDVGGSDEPIDGSGGVWHDDTSKHGHRTCAVGFNHSEPPLIGQVQYSAQQ